jgi:hypothetical protein
LLIGSKAGLVISVVVHRLTSLSGNETTDERVRDFDEFQFARSARTGSVPPPNHRLAVSVWWQLIDAGPFVGASKGKRATKVVPIGPPRRDRVDPRADVIVAASYITADLKIFDGFARATNLFPRRSRVGVFLKQVLWESGECVSQRCNRSALESPQPRPAVGSDVRLQLIYEQRPGPRIGW